MIKLIYLAKRKTGFTFDEFVRRWRMHGATGMDTPFWRHVLGYVQAEPILPAAIEGASEEFDAVACLITRDDAFAAMDEADMEGAMRMAADELETFSCPIPEVSLWVTEERIKPGVLGGITAFLFFKDMDVARAASEKAGQIEGLNRVTLNLRDDKTVGNHANTLPYAAVLECSAYSVAILEQVLGRGEDSLLRTADLAVVTREAVLWDRLSA